MGEAPALSLTEVDQPAELPRADEDLCVYTLTVGDGESIVIEFPQGNGQRAYAVVDCFKGSQD